MHIYKRCNRQTLRALHLQTSKIFEAQLPEPLCKLSRYASLLRECNSLQEGKLLHEQIRRDGHDRETRLGNFLVDMYNRCGSLTDAELAFQQIPEKNLFSWTIITTAYAQNGHPRQAIKLFRSMCAEGFLPDRAAFSTVIRACSGLGDVSEGRAIHSAIASAGLESDRVLRVALINMYAKAGEFSRAELLFSGMEVKNLICYTAMIMGYTRFGRNREALGLYRVMHLEGVKPDRVTLSTALGCCSSARDGQGVHVCVVSSGLEDDPVLSSALIHMYGRCRRLNSARRVFDRVSWSCVVVWNSMISTYTLNGELRRALEVYERMEMEGVIPDVVTTLEILGVCSELQELRRGRALHLKLRARGLESHFMVVDCLLNMYRDCGSIRYAVEVFEGIKGRNDVVAWNTMIGAYAENEMPERALKLYLEMNLFGVEPTEVTFIAVLSACSSLAARSHGEAVHHRIRSSGLDILPKVTNSLMQFYGACGDLNSATRVFDDFQNKDQISWNTMMGLYFQLGDEHQALLTFHKMDLEGIHMDDVTFVCALGVCTGAADKHKGRQIHQRLVASGRQHGTGTGSALVDMYGNLGLLEEANAAFGEIREKNTVCWNALVTGFSRQGRSREAVEIFRRMKLGGFEADSASYMAVLFACSHGGLVHEAVWCFESLMEEGGIGVTQEHYGCVADLLARAGWLERAEELMRSMPFQPDAPSLMSFMAACRVQGEVQRVAGVAELSEHRVDESAPYVILSNMFRS